MRSSAGAIRSDWVWRPTTRRCSPRLPALSTEVVTLTGVLRKSQTASRSGEGTLGQLVTNRQLYDQLNATLANRTR